jgi:hypothetical protein
MDDVRGMESGGMRASRRTRERRGVGAGGSTRDGAEREGTGSGGMNEDGGGRGAPRWSLHASGMDCARAPLGDRNTG